MKKLLYAFVVVQLVGFAQDKTPDFNLTGAGARAEGFGGAFIGLADDATAVVWNPAGLSQLERPEASVVTRVIGEGAEYKDNFDPSYNSDEQQSYFNLNFGSVALPLKSGGQNNIVVAVAFQRQLDFYELRRRDYEFEDNSNTKIKIRHRIEASGGVNTITPAVAMNFGSIFSAGVSANIWLGGMERKEIIIGTNGSQTLRDQSEISTDFSGFNLVLGGLVDFERLESGGKPFKIGITLRTPFELLSEGDYDEEIESDPSVGKNRYSLKQEVAMPLMFGIGMSYRIGDNFTVASDFEIRNFSGKSIKTTFGFGGNNLALSRDLSESKENLNQFRIGAEYLIVMDKGVIPLRGGFKTVPTVLADYNYDEVNEEYVASNTQVSGTGFSFGTGFISDLFAFDVVLSYSDYTQKYAPDGNITYSTLTVGSSVIIYF